MTEGDRAQVLRLASELRAWFNAEGLASIERDLSTHDGLVSEAGGRIVGFILWSRHLHGHAELSWMGVLEPFQRRGVGTALVAALRSELTAHGVRRVLVSTVADNVDYEPYNRTRAFYRKCGFREVRVDRGYFKDAKGDYDRLLLELSW
jgi:ribosomal protein S18 acetylase RimI-like enzyme